jgi:valyl-tRNA synthetase
MESAYDPKKTEEKIYKLWLKSDCFNPDKIKGKKYYTILLPPPNITGSLHMGHALNATIIDILIRFKRLRGFKASCLPGTDHAGIATQNAVEKELKKKGVSRFDLGREKFIQAVWQWKEKYGQIILEQLKKIGLSADWSRTRFTMDPEYSAAVKKTFIHYYKKGLIYRGERVINWCPRCQTSLSDLEIEYQEEKTYLWYLRYPLKNGGFIIVATTRPETMLGDAAVAVNPKDKKYQNLIGQKVILPIKNREIPIIADKAVDSNFGTGAVKVTPAHDLADAAIAERHQLPSYRVINEKGQIEGIKILEMREKVIQALKEKNLIEKIEDYRHNVSRCYRCQTKIEPLPSQQWFLKMSELAKAAAGAVRSQKVKIIPKRFEKSYFDWLKNTRDWCISRQIWWGHQIPAEKSTDVLDTWFSSALWPFADFSPKDLKKFYPSAVLVTARDIINLWVGRMIFSGLEFQKKEPFAKTFIHPTILTKEGKRMSKSLGTGIDPLNLIDNFGADATRFGIIWQMMGGQDIRWDETAVLAGKKFCNKIWNASRFVLERIETSAVILTKADKPTPADKKILNQLKIIKKAVEKDIENFQFGPALRKIYDFFWHQFCDVYIEKSKKQPNQKILSYVLLESLKLIHPFMPFVTEEIYQKLPFKKGKLLIIEKWEN